MTMKLFPFCLMLCLILSIHQAQAEPVVYEAEAAQLTGGNKVITDLAASGRQAVGQFQSDTDTAAFIVEIPADGQYDLVFTVRGIGGGKTNTILADGREIGQITNTGIVYEDCALKSTPLTAGQHTITVAKSWGWICLDRLSIAPSEAILDSIYEVSPTLIDPDANAETRKLFSYLCGCYGKSILSGQYCDRGIKGPEMKAIHDLTGKYPAILGLDMMDYSPARVQLGARSGAVEHAIDWHDRGGIVTFCWHWNAPTSTLKEGTDANGHPRWWGGFYTDNTSFDLGRVMSGEDETGMAALDADIAAIAQQLKQLEAAGVPVLWRPLHEASGGWFWWGASGAEAYRQLWIRLYDQLTNVYSCHNLIWVWNGQAADWYPGDAYVDVIGEDIYASPRQYNAQTSKFTELAALPAVPKIIALTENGVLFDPDEAVAANAQWAWFGTWSGDFVQKNGVYSEVYTDADMLKKVYSSEHVLTLDELRIE